MRRVLDRCPYLLRVPGRPTLAGNLHAPVAAGPRRAGPVAPSWRSTRWAIRLLRKRRRRTRGGGFSPVRTGAGRVPPRGGTPRALGLRAPEGPADRGPVQGARREHERERLANLPDGMSVERGRIEGPVRRGRRTPWNGCTRWAHALVNDYERFERSSTAGERSGGGARGVVNHHRELTDSRQVIDHNM